MQKDYFKKSINLRTKKVTLNCWAAKLRRTQAKLQPTIEFDQLKEGIPSERGSDGTHLRQ